MQRVPVQVNGDGRITMFLRSLPVLHFRFQGIMPRVFEACVVLALLAVVVCGLAWVASALLDNDQTSRQYLFGEGHTQTHTHTHTHTNTVKSRV